MLSPSTRLREACDVRSWIAFAAGCLLIAGFIGCSIGSEQLGADDAERLGINISPSTVAPAVPREQAVALANEAFAFPDLHGMTMVVLLADVTDGPGGGGQGHPEGLVWIVRYHGDVPAAAPRPSSAVGSRDLTIRYAYALIDAQDGTVLEVTFAGE